MAKRRVATQIRLDETLYELLVQIAKAENRSLNNLMEYFLDVQVKEYLQE